MKVTSTEKSVILFAWAEDEQMEWIEAIKETAERNHKRNHNLRHRGSLIMSHTAAPLQGKASRSVIVGDHSNNSKLKKIMGFDDK